jgi:tetratricopeptide (TPR) repeat protein
MSRMPRLFITLVLAAAIGVPIGALADVAAIQQDWAKAMYDTPTDKKEAALAVVADQARALATSEPQNAGALIWEGIALSTLAGEKGGLGALSLVKESRAALESALKIDPTALQGSAHTSLGSLYYQVPGWPISFGDKDKAREHLEQALTMNPDGIDPNYFMADLLHGMGKDKKALAYLDKAAKAPARPGRELADQGRHREIDVLRKQISEG